MDDLIITVAPVAPPHLLRRHSTLPRTPDEIVEEVVRCWNAGASIVHLHVLDDNGMPTTDVSVFKRTLAMIRERCDVLVEGSTGGVTGFDAAERSVALQADIELASLNTGSVNFESDVYVNTPDDIRYWVAEMARRRIKPAITVFEVGMIEAAMAYVRQGLIREPLYFNLVLGEPGAIPATPRNLLFLAETLPPGALWTCTGHGGHDLSVGVWALAVGGHVRVGFEDNIAYRPGEIAASNAALVERIVRIAREIGRPVASPARARELLGLPPLSQ